MTTRTDNPTMAQEDNPMRTEQTSCGEQYLIPGVKPVTLRERLQHLMALPLMPRCRQRSCYFGLFDEVARAQLDLFIHTKKEE